MTDLTEKVINRLAREARFKLEMTILREDYRNGVNPATNLQNHITKLARDYQLPPWLVRGLMEDG